MTKNVLVVSLILYKLVVPSSSFAEQFQAIAWNVESGGIVRSKIGSELRAFDNVHLWALSEVQAADANFFIASAADGEVHSFAGIIGSTGGSDRLLVIYDESLFDVVDTYELASLAFGGRAPLVVHFRTERDGIEFLFVALHMHRRNSTKRLAQAIGLRNWASRHTLPVVAAGDCNFDYQVPAGPGNDAFDEFRLGEVFEWEEPATLVATQYSDSDGDGTNDHDSVLDFFWSAGPAQTWTVQSEILVRPDDFPDDHRTSDHRPVLARFDTAVIQPLASNSRSRLRIATPRPQGPLAVHGYSADGINVVATEKRSRPAHQAITSPSSDRAEGFGHFEGRVAATWDAAGRDMTLLEDFCYVDPRQLRWIAESGSVVNGASIPRPFWSLIGGPFEGRYRNASVVHDVYCERRDRSWRDVHRMFYQACRCGGVDAVKSKLMYYAVYHFGPRWGDDRQLLLTESSDPLIESQMSALEAYIKWRDPSLEELESISPATFGENE